MLKALPTPTTARTVRVATSFRVDRETAELGEDHHLIRAVDRARRLLLARVERAYSVCDSKPAKDAMRELRLTVPDTFSDACFAGVLAMAKDAAYETRVVRMARSLQPSVVCLAKEQVQC